MVEKALLAVDIVVFCSQNKKKKVLLIKRKNQPFKSMYALPGGFVEKGEIVEKAAERELKEETGLTVTQLKRFNLYTKPERDPRDRVISIAFLAKVNSYGVNPKASTDAKELAWFDAEALPELAFDHEKIIQDAIKSEC
ncbi:MAG: NUDIX domain-containing protein [Nanobdellota archaeon]